MTPPSRTPLHTPAMPAWHVATSDSVRSILANAHGTDEPPLTIGDVTLMPHQRGALARIRRTIREFHGALLADEVGLGKTYVALALAHDYEHTHVIAPAALLPMWRAAIARTASPAIALHSLHAFSRTQIPQGNDTHDATTSRARNTLVIVDEAHHLRTRNTRRYHAVAEFVAGRDLLLLSATPLHNSSRELRHLLALFAGLRDDLLTPETLARLIIRHTTISTPNSYSPLARHDSPPRVREHPPLRIPHDRATLDGILALPSPLPAHDGAVAGALIRLGLLRAWCSSDAALSHVIRRRLLRGEALKQALLAGRHPTHAELRTWLVGEHEVQLAFPELLTAHTAEVGPLLEVLVRHLDSLETLLDHHQRHSVGDRARANALRHIAAAHPDTPVIAFSQFTRTVQSLYRALSDIAGVGALTGMHAHIASGRVARADAIARFAPSAQGRPPPPPHQAIRLLLSTDILAEGVNLQDAGVVVHLDLPWTDALRRQRIGRAARIGSPHDVVHVYSFAPPPPGERALALTARLIAKSTLSAQLVGLPINQTPNPPLNTRHPSAPADLATTLHATFHAWRLAASAHTAVAPPTRPHPKSTSPHPSIPVAQLASPRNGWVAAVSTGTATTIVAHTNATGIESARIWQLLSTIPDSSTSTSSSDRAATDATCAPRARPQPHALADASVLAPLPFAARRKAQTATPNPEMRHVNSALRQLQNWLADRDVFDATGPTPSATSRAQALARQRLSQIVTGAPPLARRALSPAIRTAEAVIQSATGIGAECALEAWTRLEINIAGPWRKTAESSLSRADSPGAAGPGELTSLAAPADWLNAWRAFPALRRSCSTPATHAAVSLSDAPHAPAPVQILALLLFRTTAM